MFLVKGLNIIFAVLWTFLAVKFNFVFNNTERPESEVSIINLNTFSELSHLCPQLHASTIKLKAGRHQWSVVFV